MTFKKYSIKSHYLVNKLVRIKKLTIFKNLICVVRGLILGFTRIQLFQHISAKKIK